MRNGKQPYDVFIAHSPSDRQLAAQVAEVLRSYDLCVFDDSADLTGANLEETLWDAIAESRALVVTLSAGPPGASLLVELGAAKAWNKPIYAVTSQPSLSAMPTVFRDVQVYPTSRVDEIARSIVRSGQPLSSHDSKLLSDLYVQVGMPVDQLAQQPLHLMELVKLFNKQSERQLAGEQLMSLLLRNRKQGLLPSLTKRPPKKAS
jgi:TIR domain